ncbi:MAG: hypothetical protein COB37_02670 [Kordiimonadales bacterium]|nr:MAG: hypothetical protein COB37_02670 [Kordiimonadales bacterium]
MKNNLSFRRGLFGLAIAGLAGTAMISGTSFSATAHGSSDAKEDRELESFTKIRVKGAIELHLTAGGDQRVTIETDEDRLEGVETYVRGDTLIIDMSDKRRNYWRNVDVDVTISLPTLAGLEVMGAVDAKLMNIDSDYLEIEIKGAAEIEIEGRCGELELDVKGAGDIDAKELKCEKVEIDLKGAGDASVYATVSVDADVSGVGNIRIFGKPKEVRKSVGGFGKISIR